MEGIFVSWEEKLKESIGLAMPKLSATEAQRYRRVLGQLAWQHSPGLTQPFR